MFERERHMPTNVNPVTAKVLVALDSIGIQYDIIKCDPTYADTVNFCREYSYPIDKSGNTIIVASKKDPVTYSACIVKGSARLDANKTVKRLMGVSRVSFASPEQVIALTGMLIGGITPFALPDEIPIYVDENIMRLDYVILGSGDRSSKIKVPPIAIAKLRNVRIIPGLSLEDFPKSLNRY